MSVMAGLSFMKISGECRYYTDGRLRCSAVECLEDQQICGGFTDETIPLTRTMADRSGDMEAFDAVVRAGSLSGGSIFLIV